MSKTKAEFDKFDVEHPEFWEKFREMTFSTIQRGRTRYSARTIWEVMRWHTTIDSGGRFKCEDCWVPFFARKFMYEHPQHEGFFSLKKAPYDEANDEIR
tara:strand:+ start:185 stop:481 length:297 start_codon:yes stop_codon:yes gene_type:complete